MLCCVTAGISRLERWERAKRLGRDPPVAVKQLIQQHSGKAQYTERYTHCLWHQTQRDCTSVGLVVISLHISLQFVDQQELKVDSI